MLFGEGGALRRDDVLHAIHEAGNQIQLTFADNGTVGFQNSSFGLVEAKENPAFGKDRGFGRVDVFGGLFIAGQNPPAKPDHAALLVGNRKHEPAAEAIVVISGFFFPDNQPGFFHGGEIKVFTPRPVHGVVPNFGSGSDAEEFNRFIADAAPLQILAGELAGGFAGKAVLPALGKLVVDFQELLFQVAGFLRAGRVFKFEGDFRALRQPANGVHETDFFVFFDESEHIAALVAAKTMENLLLRVDIKAGGFFLVKGTQSGEIGPGAFEWQIGTNNVNNVAGGADLFARGGSEEAGHEIS